MHPCTYLRTIKKNVLSGPIHPSSFINCFLFIAVFFSSSVLNSCILRDVWTDFFFYAQVVHCALLLRGVFSLPNYWASEPLGFSFSHISFLLFKFSLVCCSLYSIPGRSLPTHVPTRKCIQGWRCSHANRLKRTRIHIHRLFLCLREAQSTLWAPDRTYHEQQQGPMHEVASRKRKTRKKCSTTRQQLPWHFLNNHWKRRIPPYWC